MNLKQAMVHLSNGKKITHEQWEPGHYLIIDNDLRLKNQDGVVFLVCHFVNFLHNLDNPNKGWHFLNSKRMGTKNIKVGDVVRDKYYHRESDNDSGNYIVKYLLEDCVILFPLGKKNYILSYAREDWDNGICKDFVIVRRNNNE